MKTNRIFAFTLCFLTIICCLTGCSSKTAQTVAGFTEFMEASDFVVQDVTEDTETNGLATTVLIASSGDYQIEFYVLTDNDTGEGVFYNNKQLFDEEHSVKTMSSEITSGNYNYYAFNADDNFHMIARVDNTMLWCEAKKTHKEEILDIVKNLGYK